MVEPFFVKLPFLHVKAITLVFVVLYKLDKGETELDEVTRRHETIHFWQWLELFVIGFLVLYLWDFFRAWWFLGPKPSTFWNAYTCIRFEQEAYTHDKDDHYLENRKRHAWKEYDVYNTVLVREEA